MDSCDVLVVGAGPTGLLMASELIRYGLKCRIIDKNLTLSDKSRALAIQPRTLEILHLLGLSPQFLSQGQKVQGMHPMSNHNPIGHIDLSQLDSPFPFILSLPQCITEEILNDYLKSVQGSVERGFELVNLKESGGMPLAELLGPSKEKIEIQAKWVIGCDGAHSFVRKHLNCSFQGKAFPEVFSLADLEIDWKYPHNEAFIFFSTGGVLAAIPLPGKRHYRLIFQLDRCQNKNPSQSPSADNLQVGLPEPTFEEVKNTVCKHADQNATLTNPKWLANFHVNSRLANRYQKGNFFLAGDAAHIHSPIGGQGMNTGLQDAFNLSWKMALVHKGQISPHILDSYHNERHHIALRLLKGTERGTQIATLKRPWQVSMRNFILSILLKIPTLQKELIRSVSQIGIRYPKSSFVTEKGNFTSSIKVGMRIPNHHLQSASGEVEIYDLLQKPNSFFIFLFVGENENIEEITQLENKLKSLSIPLHTVIISLTPISKNSKWLYDPKGKVHQAFGVKQGASYVIRPDTYISYRQTPMNPEELIAHLNQSYTLKK